MSNKIRKDFVRRGIRILESKTPGLRILNNEASANFAKTTMDLAENLDKIKKLKIEIGEAKNVYK